MQTARLPSAPPSQRTNPHGGLPTATSCKAFSRLPKPQRESA
nr:MAG TPA: hypothetical protein [Caudoviricetes sp.]